MKLFIESVGNGIFKFLNIKIFILYIFYENVIYVFNLKLNFIILCWGGVFIVFFGIVFCMVVC